MDKRVTTSGLLVLGALLFSGCGPESEVELGASPAAGSDVAESASPLAGAPASRVLGYQWQGQQTYYWCGPAATRIALSARMTPPTQTTLASQLRTTTNGTDHIGLVVNALNHRLGVNHYSTRVINDPPTAAQEAALKQSLVASISNGYPLVANVVSGWRPSFYPGGTIYHYVAVVGYDQGGDRALIADSGAEGHGGSSAWYNVPRTYWVTTRQLAVWIGGKGYAGTSLPVGPHSSRVGGAIGDKYRALGGAQSFLGEPLIFEQPTPNRTGAYVHFQGGSIYWSPETGAWSVRGAIRKLWETYGWEQGILGFPISDEGLTLGGVGRFSHFERGSIYWTPAGGAFEVHGAIYRKWASMNWERGVLGYPVTNERTTPDGVGRYNHFENGSIYWTPAHGAAALHGPILDAWEQQNFEKGPLGYPTGDVQPYGGGQRATFQNGTITVDSSGRVTIH